MYTKNITARRPQGQMVVEIILISCLCMTKASFADTGPWYTGPIIAPSGVTTPKGHTDLEIYSFFVEDQGIYDRHSKLIPTPTAKSNQLSATYFHGLTDSLDMQFTFPFSVNRFEGKTYQGVSDMQVLLGYQLYAQTPGSWFPNVRATIQETIPTGKYDHLNPALRGTDANGMGSYRTTFNLNFQTQYQPFVDHYLRIRFALHATDHRPVYITGISQYGGAADTSGQIKPGRTEGVDLAAEFTVTQNWVLVMEGYYSTARPTSFYGYTGLTNDGKRAKLGHGFNDEVSLAPAIEYNFTANYGLIAGVWYSLEGKDTPKFFSPVIAFNAYW